MGVNVVKLANGETLVDMSDATITEDTVLEGYTGYGANGELIVGKAASTKHFAMNITLPADGWEDHAQTVPAPGVLADEEKCTVFAGPDISSDPEYGNSDVWCSAQGDDTLTFGCVFVPDADLTVNVTVFVSGGNV